METVKLVAGTDMRDGVEVQIEINAGGNRDMIEFIKEALTRYEREEGDFASLDFVQEVSTFDIPEDVPYTKYAV